MDDEPGVTDLVRAATDGDAAAWDALVARYTPLVLSIVRGYRLQESDVRDIFQTVWLRLVEHLRNLREPRALPGWLITTSRNESLRTLKLQARMRPVPVVFESDAALSAEDRSIEDDLLRVERREAVLEAFAELGDRDRELLRLLAADPPVPYVEISQQLHMSIGSIGPTRARILTKLREHPSVAALSDAVAAAERGYP
jgi:RNA polymerase sigma factor (sigma-70 family)